MTNNLLAQIPSISPTKCRVVVAMSGGVDSSTVAAILANQGHEVIGITLQLYESDLPTNKKGSCCAGKDIYDARTVADKIGIPHYVFNYKDLFKKAVIDDFVDSYLYGETPIPCIKCNQKVKFRDLLKAAKDIGASCLATGHYVRRIEINGKAQLHTGIEHSKDQSYFLFTTTQEQLDYLRFPLGGLKKEQTRELAKFFALDIAEKPDSQDICFVQNGSYASLVEKLRPGALEPGNIVLKDGSILGKHNGIVNFTIGQRRRIGISNKEALYVIKINPEQNEVVVGTREDLSSTGLTISELNWIGDYPLEDSGYKCLVKLRSTHKPTPAIIYPMPNNRAKILLDEPNESIAAGQACVIYEASRLLGGGWIERGELK